MAKFKTRQFAALILFFAAAQGQYCDELQKEYDKENRLPKWVSVNGATRDEGIELWWGHEAGRAEAALLRVRLQRELKYRRVRLRRGPPRLRDLEDGLRRDPALRLHAVAVAVAARWRGEPGPPCEDGRVCDPPLQLLGEATAAARRALHVRAECPPRALFADLAACPFDARVVDGRNKTVVYYVVDSEVENDDESAPANKTGPGELQLCIEAAGMHPEPTTRRGLLAMLAEARRPVLFVDYAFWGDEAAVRRVRGAPCADAVAVRASDAALELFEPELHRALRAFRPPPASLRRLLRLEAEGAALDEAACRVAAALPKADAVTRFYVNVQLCQDDPAYARYKELLRRLDERFARTRASPDFEVRLRYYDVLRCASLADMMDAQAFTLDSRRRLTTLGVVSPGPERGDAHELALQCARAHMPLLLYAQLARPEPGALSAAGAAGPLARALARLAAAHAWRRVAVALDEAPAAAALLAALRAEGSLRLHRVPAAAAPEAALRELRRVDARVVLVDAGAAAAAALVAAGPPDPARVWIVREWTPSAALAAVRVYELSYWPRPVSGAPEECGGGGLPRGGAIVAAAVTLKSIYDEIVANATRGRFDLHSPEILREFEARASRPRPGPCGRDLRYESGALVDPPVYLYEWRGLEVVALGECAGPACELRVGPAGEVPGDGGDACLLRWGPFEPCWDGAATAGGLGAAALALLLGGAAFLGRRSLRRHVARRERGVRARLLAGRERAVSELAGRYLVPREALRLHEELGAGRFGRVRRAELRLAGRATRVVAAKAPRAGAAPSEEAELLREAGVLAALEHPHVVRLAGLVADDGPPLVLMEHALFGDLRGYLRARRALAGAGAAGGEAAHVGPAALTRLAREAAAALAYLGARGLVHRDVRAANCLLDARRRLRLADFGMARETAAAERAAPEYACRSRGLFPVLWMAPESLSRGAFSAASDVWALGVLLLELVTLGERPFGEEPPLRVLRFVVRGGLPPLPADASAATRFAALACWRRAASARPSAAQLEAYFAARPAALRPALARPRSPSADSDSGFGEPPSPDADPFPCEDTRLSPGLDLDLCDVEA